MCYIGLNKKYYVLYIFIKKFWIMCFNQVFPSPNFSDPFQIFIHPTLCLFLYIFKINKQKGNTEKQKQETHEMPHKK